MMSHFDPSGLGAEESLRRLLDDDYPEVAKHARPHGVSGDKAPAGFSSSEWLSVDELVGPSDFGKEDPFLGTDWMLEKIDLKEFDFDLLPLPEELLATLDNISDPVGPLVQESDKEPPQIDIPIGHLPESFPKTDQVAPFTLLQPLSTPDHSSSLELGSEVVIPAADKNPAAPFPVISLCIKEEGAPSDDDSGVCMSPESYLGSPQPSPPAARASPSRSLISTLISTGALNGPARPKPYDPPGELVIAKLKGEKLDKKLKKMEQNKTAATRYRQKKRAEQEALTGECKELEKKNEALKERADSLAKEIQYLKDLMEEVRRARGKKQTP